LLELLCLSFHILNGILSERSDLEANSSDFTSQLLLTCAACEEFIPNGLLLLPRFRTKKSSKKQRKF
jgi:hypothetical protein